MRKYLSEFGLTVFSSYKTLIPVEDLEKVNDNAEYHIYMILDIPKISIDDNTKIICNKNGITLNLVKIENGKKEIIEIKDYKPFYDIDNYESYEANTTFPYNNLNFRPNDKEIDNIYNIMPSAYLHENKINKEKFKRELKKGIDIQVECIYFAYLNRNNQDIDMEVLYIGQAFGKKGERLAQHRLKNHSTLQKILIDCNTKHPDKRLYILLLEFATNLNISFDGISKQYAVTNEEDTIHMEKVFKMPPKENQIINITEAALINYFKPQYNVNFINNFPDPNHIGYKQYFDLDYNCINVELDLNFEKIRGLSLYSKVAQTDSYRNTIISYNLFNDPNRTNMFDIFGEISEDKK